VDLKKKKGPGLGHGSSGRVLVGKHEALSSNSSTTQKKKIQLFAVCKKLTSMAMSHSETEMM
jgi:hypothetical protein